MLLALLQARDEGGAQQEVEERFQELEKMIVDVWGLSGCWDMKPLLDGGKICQVLNLDKKKKEDGIKIGVLTREMIDWQLSQERPLEVTPAQAEVWLLETHSK